MTDPLDPMLPPTPGSESDRIMRDHRAMEALRRGGMSLHKAATLIDPFDERAGRNPPTWYACVGAVAHYSDDPADAILACDAAIEAASTDSGQRQA